MFFYSAAFFAIDYNQPEPWKGGIIIRNDNIRKWKSNTRGFSVAAIST